MEAAVAQQEAVQEGNAFFAGRNFLLNFLLSKGGKSSMTYIIAEPYVNVKDGACVDVCPVDCIHPTNSEPDYQQHNQLYIKINADYYQGR